MGKLFGAFAFDLAGKTAYVYSFVVLLLVFLLLRMVTRSPFGLALRGIRENPQRMESLGVPVRRRLVAAYTLSAAIAGVAGGLLAQTTQFVGIDTLGFQRSAELLVMLVLGGTGRLYGAIIGAGVFMLAQDFLAAKNPVYWEFWLGLALVAFVLFARGGILGGVRR